MKSAKFINITVRFSLIFAIANFVFSEAKSMQLNAAAYLMIICMTFLCSAFLKDKKALLVLCILAEFIPIIFAKSFVEALVLISAIVYSVYYILKEKSDLKYGEYFDEFKKSSIAALLLIAIGLADTQTFTNSCAVYLFIYMVSSILLLRILRNLEFSKDNEQVHKLNMIYGAAVFILAFILKIDVVREGIYKILGDIYYVIAEILTAFAYGLGVIVITCVQFFGRLFISKYGMHYKANSQKSQDAAQFVVPDKKTILQTMLDNSAISIIIKLLLIVIIVFVVVKVFKAKKSNINETEDYIEEKEYIKEETNKSKRGIFSRIKPKSYSEQVRYMYYKLMKVSIKKEVDIKTSDTTLEINKKSQSVFEKSVLDQIRGIYIKIRYSDLKADKETKEAMEAYYKKIK